jgi:two-component system cell cycle response regulator
MATSRPLARSLVIGHHRSSRQALAETIEATRFFGPILQAKDPVEARIRLEKTPADMIFFDGEDMECDFGWLQSRIRTDWRDIPVVLFIREENEADRIAALEAGAADCLAYSTSAKEVAARLRRHLETKERIDQLRRAKSDLERQAITDPLTGLCNRGFFNLTLESEAARSHRTRKPFSLIMIDLDHFKSINDTFGHQAGDSLLKEVAGALQASTRKSDVVCRYGGEEFALILPGAKIASAQKVAERIHRQIAALGQPQRGLDIPVTVSIGISSCSGTSTMDPTQLLEEADQALYAAKSSGRNRTEVHERPGLLLAEGLSSRFFSPVPHPA